MNNLFADRLRLVANQILGRKTVLRIDILGQSLLLGIEAQREIRRAYSISHEAPLLEKMFAFISGRDVVYDVGANIGLISFLLAKHPSGSGCIFHSFEPEPRNYRELCRNIELNGLAGRVTPHQLALGTGEGEVELFVRGGAGEGRHSIATSKGSTGSIKVAITTMAAFAGSCGQPPDVVKIDVEGAEGQVLAGMDGLLKSHPPRELFMEIHPKGEGDRMPGGETIQDWLVKRGYTLAWEQQRRSGQHRHYHRNAT